MKTILSTLIAATTFAVITPTLADGPHGYNRVTVQAGHAGQHPLAGLRDINMRQQEQRARIEHGFHQGAITRWEFRRLMAEQQDIQALERVFVADGFLAPHERMELNRRLDIASQHVFFEAHDHQRRF